MRNMTVKVLTLLFLLFLPWGCAEEITHDEKLAATRAVEFAEATFVRRHLDKGYALLTDKTRAYVPLEIFTDKVTKMHPSGYPSKVTPVGSVLPVKGEKIIHVRLRGDGGGGRFEYAVTVAGTAATDYRVTTFSGGRTS